MRRTLVDRPVRPTLAAAVLFLVTIAVVASSAAANVPEPVTRIDPVRIPWTGAATNGILTTRVTYTDTSTTAAASTGDTIAVGKGFVFRLFTCVAYHLYGMTPVSSCSERSVDTRANTDTVYTHAPSVTLYDQPRPTAQPWGYFTVVTEVRDASSLMVLARSWPDNGLQGAGIAVAAQGQDGGTLPPNAIVTLDGPFTSAINSGEPDSICGDQPVPPDGSALPAGVTSTHDAFADAPAYYEVGLPSGAHAGQAPLGVMLIVSGGGWTLSGVGEVQQVRPDADRWRARGWETVNLTYRPCGQSLADTLWFYDRARAWFGADAKICALGSSAAGHLALLIGAERPDLYCAVSMAGPTDLTRIQAEGAYDSVTGEYDSTLGGRWVHNLGAAAFGEENLPSYSPAARVAAGLRRTRVLQAFSAHDAIVPYQQATDLADAMRAANPDAYVDDVQLEAGTLRFAHAPVSQSALDEFYAREERLVAPVAAPTVAPGRR
jgi:acetyl esterase/lipase